MGDAFIVRRGGGIKDAFAAIDVTYPVGSVCTATNGSKTLRAKGAIGRYLFLIPEPSSLPETWTVSCTDGINTTSKPVSITTQYQSENIFLTYALVLYKDGDLYGYPWKIYLQNQGSSDPAGSTLKARQAGGGNFYPTIGPYINAAVDVTDYSTLCCHIAQEDTQYAQKIYLYLANSVNDVNPYNAYTTSSKRIATGELPTPRPADMIISCDISEITGEKFIGALYRNKSTSAGAGFEIDHVWLEP